MKSKSILVTGVSGTGKSTVLSELQERGIKAVGIDETQDLSCWVNKKTNVPINFKTDFNEEFLASHNWVCNISLLKNILKETKELPIVICGSSDNILNCMKLVDITLLLECSPETFVARIQSRTDNDYGKNKGAEVALLNYYKTYNKECTDAGAITVDAEQPIKVVLGKVLSYIQ